MHVKTHFSIKDLENLSGVKAHTIRIWEKRYSLLEPDRTETNIRTYNIESLKKLLNVTFLYNNGHKISKIAGLSDVAVCNLIQEHALKNQNEFAIQSFKSAMFEFDTTKFATTYALIEKTKSFREMFSEIFIPLLAQIGYLWQAGTIDPTHERFFSELLKQKIYINIEREQQKQTNIKEEIAFSLFLPYDEIHEIGLLYAHYEIISAGFKSIYLGANIPLESLQNILDHYDHIIFASYFTVKPDWISMQEYIGEYLTQVCSLQPHRLWVMGGKSYELDYTSLPENIIQIKDIPALHSHLENLKKS